MYEIEKFNLFEIILEKNDQSNGIIPHAVFKLRDIICHVDGFCENEEKGTIRFMPREEGEWRYSAEWGKIKSEGSFNCVKNTGTNHGPVKTDGFKFIYADGSRYIPVGTTCYAWIHQPAALIERTLNTLKTAPFTKLRMLIFPKHMPFNNNEPELFPFEKENGHWDMNKPCVAFWELLENNIAALANIGIEADLILFHPYDKWGFSQLEQKDNLKYIDYLVRRLSAFRNVWWSIANEWDFSYGKSEEEWDELGEKVFLSDPYSHLTSIHNGHKLFPMKKWMTHISMQTHDMRMAAWRRVETSLPLIIDEYGYEGSIEYGWGNLSGFEHTSRAWMAVCFGLYFTHGETFYRDDEVLWWSKGGDLYGESPTRLAFLKKIMEEAGPLDPFIPDITGDLSSMEITEEYGAFARVVLSHLPVDKRRETLNRALKPIAINHNCILMFLDRACSSYMHIQLPKKSIYKAEVIDIWNMTKHTAVAKVSGRFRLSLPGKEGVAVLLTRISE